LPSEFVVKPAATGKKTGFTCYSPVISHLLLLEFEETGSHVTASTTTQPLQTAHFRHDAK
jgi:hypothetical protein